MKQPHKNRSIVKPTENSKTRDDCHLFSMVVDAKFLVSSSNMNTISVATHKHSAKH